MHSSDYVRAEKSSLIVCYTGLSAAVLLVLAASDLPVTVIKERSAAQEDSLYAIRSFPEEVPSGFILKKKKEPYYNKFGKNRKKGGRNRW